MGVHAFFHGDQLVVPNSHINAQGHARGALTKVLLTDEWVAQLARLSLAMNQPHVHAAVLVSSVFLLRVGPWALKRVRSAMPKSCRQVDTVLSGLSHVKEDLNPYTSGWPEGSTDHKAAYWYVLAPAQEHHYTVAPCTRWRRCSVTRVPVSPLFDLTSSSFLKAVRRMLTLLGHKEANKCTLKAFRAGRATSLAAAGSPKGMILAAGEWKSSAFLRYCQADDVSVSAVLEVVCAEDED